MKLRRAAALALIVDHVAKLQRYQRLINGCISCWRDTNQAQTFVCTNNDFANAVRIRDESDAGDSLHGSTIPFSHPNYRTRDLLSTPSASDAVKFRHSFKQLVELVKAGPLPAG